MPHRTLLGVLKGDAKIDGTSEDEPGGEIPRAVSNDPASKANVDGNLHPLSSSPVRHSNSSVEDSRGSSRSQSPGSNDLRLLKSSSAEQGLWRQAWEECEKENKLSKLLPPQLRSVQTLDTMSQVRGVREEAQKRASDTKEHEKKIPHTNKTYREIYGKVASCANKFQIVGDMVSQAEPVYAALPWALIRFGIQCAVGEDEAYHTMLSGAELVSDLVSQYPALEQLYAKINSELSRKLRKSLVAFYKTILTFQVYAINYFDPDSKARRALSGMNPVSADNIARRQQAILDLKHKVDEDAALVSYEVTKTGVDNLKAGQEGQDQQLEAIKDGIKALAGNTGEAFRKLSREQDERNKILIDMWKEPLDDLRTELENREIEKARENLHSVRRWLSIASPRDDLQAARDKRQMSLGNWLLDHPRFRRWQSSEDSAMLVLHGFAGTGKTGLVCRVIQQIEASMQKTGRIAFFFCSNDKANTSSKESFSRSDPEEALRSIVSQLATSQEGNYVAPILQSKYDAFEPGSDQSMNLSYLDCIEVLVAISEHTSVTIILDAFDECDQSRSPRLIQDLQEVIHRSPINIKIFISTRPFPAIEDNLTPDRSIEVAAENNGADVKEFIRSTLEDRIHDKSLLNGDVPDDLKGEIELTLTRRAGNMFLYASLLLSQLCDKNHNDDPASIRKKLESLPRDLTDVYNRIMTEIHDDRSNSERSCQIAQNTFKWLLCAQEPLACDELLEAISPLDRKARHDEILRSCRTLVIKEREAFQFAHYSVREHIVQMEEYRPSQCHLVATQSCLNILEIAFGTEKSRSKLSEAQKSFEQYALLYWPLHYEGIEQADMRDQRAAINGLLRSLLLQGRSQRNKYHEWFEEVRKKEKKLRDNRYLASKLSALQASPLSPLFAACVFGLEDLIAKFGRELDGLNKLNDHGQSALCLAIENNKLDVVKALLSRRFPADLNLLNLKAVEQLEEWNNKPHDVIVYASALQCAAATGHLEIAEFLIQQGAHIDLVAGYYGSPLQAASLRGHATIVELLLRKGAEPNSQGGYYGNALEAASVGGHTVIINLLLENKPPALVDTPGGHYGSALRAAVHKGYSDAVWALLEEKANPNRRIKGHGSLLEEAVSMGPTHKDIVRDLVNAEAEADFSSKGNEAHIMHHAAMFGMAEMVELCLKKRCPISMTTKQTQYQRRFGDFQEEMTPLGFACAEGHEPIVEILLDHGASFEEDRPHSAILWTAAYQGNAEVLDLLLRRYKDTHSPEETAKFLLKRPHPKSGHPIMFAGASSGSADVVKTLIKHGAKYESNWFKATPLLATATFGCPEVTRFFLDYHHRKVIDVGTNNQANHGRTALYEACSKEQPVVAKMLLDAGADYRITEKDNTTPLQVACFKGMFSTVLYIVEKAAKELDRAQFLDFLNTKHRPTGNVALMDCAERDRLSCLNLLLDHGADYRIPGNGNYTTLFVASRHGNSAIMAALVGKAARELERQEFLGFINTRHSSGKTALIDCAERNRQEAVEILLRHGADYKIAGHAGNNPLHWACTGGHSEVVRTLLKQAKSDDSASSPFSNFVNCGNKKGITPLMEASKKNSLPTVKVLLSYGAEYITSRIGGEWPNCTALHDACFNGSREVALHILSIASQELGHERFEQFLNARNSYGKTALSDAANSGRPLITKILISKYNADYSIAAHDAVTALHAASWNGHTEVVSNLLSCTSQDPDQERYTSFLNHRNNKGKTALMDACERARPEIVRLLLDRNADWSIGDNDRFTALHYSAFRNRQNCVRMLLEKASQDPDQSRFRTFLNQQGGRGIASPLRDAALAGHTDVCKILLQYDPIYDSIDSGKRHPLHQALGTNNAELARLLVEHAGKDADKGRVKRLLYAKDENGDHPWNGANWRKMGRVVDAMRATGVIDS